MFSYALLMIDSRPLTPSPYAIILGSFDGFV